MSENKKEVSKKIGKNIYNLRKEKKLSREKFAEMCNLSSQYVYYMEKGEYLPGCMTILDICNNFSITPSQLLGDCLESNFNLLDESVKECFDLLSADDKKFVQNLISYSIAMLLEKEEYKTKNNNVNKE